MGENQFLSFSHSSLYSTRSPSSLSDSLSPLLLCQTRRRPPATRLRHRYHQEEQQGNKVRPLSDGLAQVSSISSRPRQALSDLRLSRRALRKKDRSLGRMKALGDLSNCGKPCMAEASQNQLSVTFVGNGDVCKPQWTPELGTSEVHASNSGNPSMTASQKQPSVIDNYKCKFVMTKEERARQRFMHNHGKCMRFLYDFKPKCIPDKLPFHPSPKRRTSWQDSKILRFRTSSSLPDPCFSGSLTFDHNMMVREEPESPTH